MKIEFLGGNTKEEIEKRLKIVATAGALSRFEGTVTQVLENHNDYETNLKLARAVVGYGHRSIAEHDYLIFALEDVTAIIEQIIIGYRLTSFTIKSRRNVDFENAGFYTPNFRDANGLILKNNGELQKKYNIYMKSLFKNYGKLSHEGLPLEDCRYILPYCYKSNIIMGCDANEFLNMTSDLLYGKNSNITEVRELGEKFKYIIDEYVPYLNKALNNEENKSYYCDKLSFLDDEAIKYGNLDNNLLNKVQLFDHTKDADLKVIASTLMNRYQCNYEQALNLINKMSLNSSNIKRDIMCGIINSKNKRELEQVIFSYQIPISLAVLTHITRHRMHSLLIPDYTSFNLDNYITPNTIKSNYQEWYDEIFKNNKIMRESFIKEGVSSHDLVYFLLSGNACNITTTMNARTLEWISRMRCCNKAQWEIRDIVNDMVSQASNVAPLIGESLGPSCKVLGYCQEGKDSCKNRGIVKYLKK